MKKNKVITSMAAVALVLSLAACGKSATDSSTTTSDADSVSSHKVAKSSSKSSSSVDKKSSSNDESITSSITGSESTGTTKNTGSSVVVTQSGGDNNSSTTNDQQTLDESEARGLLKVHFGTQAGDNQQNASVTQTQTDAVDNMVATYNGNNTWTFTGNVNGQQVSYTVSPTSIYQN